MLKHPILNYTIQYAQDHNSILSKYGIIKTLYQHTFYNCPYKLTKTLDIIIQKFYIYLPSVCLNFEIQSMDQKV